MVRGKFRVLCAEAGQAAAARRRYAPARAERWSCLRSVRRGQVMRDLDPRLFEPRPAVLSINSALRPDAEQARLFAQNPNPKWVAPPSTSLHRFATELDLGAPAAYPWLQDNRRRFGSSGAIAGSPAGFCSGVG